jgi:hypothetical protein
VSDRCPLYRQKRTSPGDQPMSAKCRKQTNDIAAKFR